MNIYLLYPEEKWSIEFINQLDINGTDYMPQTTFKEGDILLLLDAFRYQHTAWNLGHVWQLWLLKNAPKVNFVVLGWASAIGEEKGYIDLLTLDSGLKVSEIMRVATAPANMKLPIEGLQASSVIKRLVDGHGEKSLLKEISKLLSFIDTLLFMIEEDGDETLWKQQQTALENLATPLLNAWANFDKGLQNTPLAHDSQQAFIALNKLTTASAIATAHEPMNVLFQFSRLLTQWQQWLY